MDKVTLRALALALLVAAPTAAQQRLAVYEFFGRPAGQYCRDAAPAVIALQEELDGRAVLLEYDYDRFPSGRVDRWWAAHSGGGTVYLPLVMVGSGFRTSYGPVDYLTAYRTMLNAELARPPDASMSAWSRRQGSSLRVYVRAQNLSGAPLTTANSAALWLLAWEDLRKGLTDTWVRATVPKMLTATLQPGAVVTATLDTPALSDVNWSALRSLVLLEHRPGGTGRHDMLQAAIASPAALEVSPPQLELTPIVSCGTVALQGPHVLEWSATSDAPWLSVEPTTGTLPGAFTVSLAADHPGPGATATVQVTAAGDGMSFSASVTVDAATESPRIRRRAQSRQAVAPPVLATASEAP